jgi:ERCC4-type nuclease
MDYLIKFDNRERELIKILKEKEYDIILENLDIGDIQFVDLSTKEIIIIIERKTLSDLSSSIKDNRYKEQKERLIFGLKKSVRKIILIEGDDINDFTLPTKTYNSIIINTLLRDNIHIYESKSKESTIEFIENIILNLAKYYDDLKKEIIDGEQKLYPNEYNCNIIKKDNLTPDICFKNMLALIPGVSINMAKIYVDKYKNLKSFIYELDNIKDKKEIIKILANEKYGNRRIGEKVAEKIYIYILKNEEFIPKEGKDIIKKDKITNLPNISLFSK